MRDRSIAITARESRLLEAAQGGDAVAFSSLVGETAPALERLALRMLGHRHDAEDIAQDAKENSKPLILFPVQTSLTFF